MADERNTPSGAELLDPTNLQTLGEQFTRTFDYARLIGHDVSFQKGKGLFSRSENADFYSYSQEGTRSLLSVNNLSGFYSAEENAEFGQETLTLFYYNPNDRLKLGVTETNPYSAKITMLKMGDAFVPYSAEGEMKDRIALVSGFSSKLPVAEKQLQRKSRSASRRNRAQ